MKHGKFRIYLIVAFAVLCGLAVYFSLKCDMVGTIISVLGSIASLYAIIEALSKVKSIERQNNEIKEAVNRKITSINRQETTEQINKYIEVIARIQSFINFRNAEAALLKCEELQFFLHNIQCNPTTTDDIKEVVSKHIRVIKQDSLVLRSRESYEPFPQDADCRALNRHLEDLHMTLMKYSQQIHFEK